MPECLNLNGTTCCEKPNTSIMGCVRQAIDNINIALELLHNIQLFLFMDEPVNNDKPIINCAKDEVLFLLEGSNELIKLIEMIKGGLFG